MLEVDPFNLKALYRRSQAYMKISEFEKAEADIRRALTIDPNNRYSYLPSCIHSQKLNDERENKREKERKKQIYDSFCGCLMGFFLKLLGM